MQLQVDEASRQSLRFAVENRRQTWNLLLWTLLLLSCTVAAALNSSNLYIGAAAGIIAGLLQLRLFSFYHDTQHGAIFSNSTVGKATMVAAGLYLMTPPSIWRETHNYHHRHNAQLSGSQIGSYPIVTRQTWYSMTPAARLKYRLMRHPANIVLGYFTVFIYGMALGPFFRSPREHWMGLVAVILHFGLFGVFAVWFSPIHAFFAIVLPLMISSMVGSYLFFAQHNFPGQHLNTRDQWSSSEAALRSSSMFQMGGIMHWFTGNIGYHHVHHLNAHIPFYRLAEAMDSIPALHNPGTTSWKMSDIMACVGIGAWDPAEQRSLNYRELSIAASTEK